MQVLKRKQLMLVKVQQKIMTVITMTTPTVLLRAHQEAVPINLPDLQAVTQEAVLVATVVLVAVNQTAAPVAEVQAAVLVAEVNLAEAVLVEAVPVVEVNLAEALLVVENLPVVKVQNNV